MVGKSEVEKEGWSLGIDPWRLWPGPDSILVPTLSPGKVGNGKSVDDLSKRRAAAGESVCGTIFGEELLVGV